MRQIAATQGGFNGATAMKPWKRRAIDLDGRWRWPCFNGATAMKPWKRTSMVPFRVRQWRALQWGHGDEAVEEQRSDSRRRRTERRASMGPRR